LSHDTDKLIRQLSLVAFLMAERRALTARDVKTNVEGYQEMSDEAFARRFYSDRAELIALGVPLKSQRDEFTGEELYTLRSEQYFLPPLELSDDELAALQTYLYALEGRFAYAEPLRLALQNLALGRPGFPEAPTRTAVRVERLDPDYSPELQGRLSKLEGAISKQRTVKFTYWSISRDATGERTVNPLALLNDNGIWYVVAEDLDAGGMRKKFRVSRIRSDIRFATRRERDFRFPADFHIDEYRDKTPWQLGDIVGEARIEVSPDTAWWVERTFGRAGRVEDGVFVTEYSNLDQLASWVLRQDGRAVPLEPDDLRRVVGQALRDVREAHEGAPPETARPARRHEENGAERAAAPVAPERFAVLQALLAYLLAACGDQRDAEIPAAELTERLHIPPEELEEHLSLLNLVNFGGGCYTVYAELHGETVQVDKELYGETFRAAPRLTPLEARAIRLALDFVGPGIAAQAHTPLDRVRRKLEETFGQFDLAQMPELHTSSEDERLIATFADAIRDHRLVAVEYQKEGEQTWSQRVVEPYFLERQLPHWYVHTWDTTSDGPRTFRLDRMRNAKVTRETFEPRDGFDPQELENTRAVRVLYLPEVARWEVEKGAQPLQDGSALAELSRGEEYVIGEVLSYRGRAVLLEPKDVRQRVLERAKELATELGVARMRAATGPRAARA
jgi:predicted DNA-binding transcriptional regulator YafY